MTEQPARDEFLNIFEAAEFLGLATNTLLRWRSDNNPDAPKCYKWGNRLRYKRSDLWAWAEAHKEEGK
jgi:predicted DNA-binding transcriptional regulator AlpA